MTVKLEDASPELVTKVYEDESFQSDVRNWVGLLRMYDRLTEDKVKRKEEILTQCHKLSRGIASKLPYDTIFFEGKETSDSFDLTWLAAAHLSELGILPDYDKVGDSSS